MRKYENEIIKEICKECNFTERIIIKRFKGIFIKTYKIGITFGFNNK